MRTEASRSDLKMMPGSAAYGNYEMRAAAERAVPRAASIQKYFVLSLSPLSQSDNPIRPVCVATRRRANEACERPWVEVESTLVIPGSFATLLAVETSTCLKREGHEHSPSADRGILCVRGVLDIQDPGGGGRKPRSLSLPPCVSCGTWEIVKGGRPLLLGWRELACS